MTSDVTGNTGAAYLALKRVFEDLTRLGADFGEAVREGGYELSDSEEYSPSPNLLVLKKHHAWFFSKPVETIQPENERVLTFAACFVYFEADRSKWKCSPAGRPELWFFAGRTTPPPTIRWSSTIHSFFDVSDVNSFKSKPTLGGSIHRYSLKAAVEQWNAVCLGFELGDITSPDVLKMRAVQPLLDAAQQERLLEP